MGSLPQEQAGVGAAVNDTTRELGGTLGVAVVGSVFASVYGPKIGDFLAQYPVPAEAVAAAKESVAAALSVAAQAPAELQGSFADAASSAFVEGMSRGSLVAAGVAFVGAIAAALFLPGRLTPGGRASSSTPWAASPASATWPPSTPDPRAHPGPAALPKVAHVVSVSDTT